MRRGFGFHDRHSPARFDPATLFASGSPAAWYDPSDLTTLYQDHNGTTPVTASGQSVGLVLDKSAGLALGSQLVVNGDFSQGSTGWTTGTAWTISGGQASASAGTGLLMNSTTMVVNRWYQVSFTLVSRSAGTVSYPYSGDGGMYVVAPTTPGTYTAILRCTGNGNIGIFASGFTGTIDNVSVRQLSGNHAYQSAIASRPIYTLASGFSYLAFDGSNDSILTNSINFTATNKMMVCAGLLKSSDAAQGVVAELSATIASNNGAFLLSAPNSAAANYNWSSKGTTQVDNTVTTYTAPHTAVVTGQADIAAPSNIIRVNGVQAGSVATTQGTGNFGNYPLFIGRRNNATLPLNGRIYGLIVLGAAASPWQLFAVEQYMAQKTGISII